MPRIRSRRNPQPPRPPNAFFIFRSEKFATPLKQSGLPGLQTIVSKDAGKAWKALSKEDQDIYYEKALQAEREHKQKYPNYTYRPRVPRKSESTQSKGSDRSGSPTNERYYGSAPTIMDVVQIPASLITPQPSSISALHSHPLSTSTHHFTALSGVQDDLYLPTGNTAEFPIPSFPTTSEPSYFPALSQATAEPIMNVTGTANETKGTTVLEYSPPQPFIESSTGKFSGGEYHKVFPSDNMLACFRAFYIFDTYLLFVADINPSVPQSIDIQPFPSLDQPTQQATTLLTCGVTFASIRLLVSRCSFIQRNLWCGLQSYNHSFPSTVGAGTLELVFVHRIYCKWVESLPSQPPFLEIPIYIRS